MAHRPQLVRRRRRNRGQGSTAADGAALLAPGTAAAARPPVMAVRRESGAERAATVAGSMNRIDFMLRRLVWAVAASGICQGLH